jgi:transcriptional regulator with XRE-family HTH domain
MPTLAKRKIARNVPLTGMHWLRSQMEILEMRTLEDVAQAIGINRGNLYRYFTFETRPSIALLPDLCYALSVDVNTLLRALEIIDQGEEL